MLWIAIFSAGFLAFALKAAAHTTDWPLELPRIGRLGHNSVARESVEFLAATYEIPRHTVSLVAEGYDRPKRQTWALTKAPYMAGTCCDLTIKPDGGEVRHEHYCQNVLA
jgi:hypothetical protein